MGSPRQLEYYVVEEEATWGTNPDSAGAGVAFDEYGVELENDATQLDKFTGEIDDVFVDITSQDLRGGITSQVWPDNTALLLAMAGLPREADYNMKSYSIMFNDYPKGEKLVHTGLKADSVTITASGGDPKLKFQMDMIGKTEAVYTGTQVDSVPSLPSQPAFEFHDGTFTIAGSAESNVSEFSIAISNNLAPAEARDANRNIKWLDAGRRQIEVTFTVRTDSTMANHYRSLVRSRNRECAFVSSFNYPGTGSPIDTLSLTLGRLVLRSAVRTGGVGDIQTLACTAVARKPASTDAIVAATT